MTRNFNAEIRTATQELERRVAEMAEIEEALISTAARLLADWYRDRAKRVVESESQVTLGLGPEALGELKRDVEELADRSEEVAREFLGPEEIWWHRDRGKARSDRDYLTYRHRMAPAFDRPLRYALGRLAAVLEPKGYLKPKQEVDSWRIREHGYSSPSGSHYFPWDVKWPTDLMQVAERYSELHRAADRDDRQIAELQTLKSRAEASDLWDKV